MAVFLNGEYPGAFVCRSDRRNVKPGVRWRKQRFYLETGDQIEVACFISKRRDVCRHRGMPEKGERAERIRFLCGRILGGRVKSHATVIISLMERYQKYRK